MTRGLRDYLLDILKYAQVIQEYTVFLSFEEFEQSEEKALAVMMAFLIIGEASKNIPEDFRSLYPQIEWRKMTGMRDKIIHQYAIVDLRVLWNTAHDKIPDLIKNIEAIIEQEV